MAAPTDVPNLDVWYRASSVTGLVDGDQVASWSDESGNGYTATQGTPAGRPIYKTGILNGLPALRFDGVDDQMDSAASTSLDDTTVFVVMRVNFGATRATPRGASANGGLQFRTDSGKTQLVNQGVAAMGIGAGVVSDTDHSVRTATFSNASNAVAFYLNGAADGTATYTGNFTAGRTTAIGRNGTNSGDRMNGDLVEVIAYSRVLTTAERATVHSYLQDTYAITVADYVSGGAEIPEGAAVGSTVTVGTASGSTVRSGSTVGSTTTTGTATGTAPAVAAADGTATGSTAHTGVASGTAPAIGVPEGTATGSTTHVGTATGSTVRSGTGSGSHLYVGTATGSAPAIGGASGSTVGQTVTIGTATGSATSTGVAVGLTTITGTATGLTLTYGTATGLTAWDGTAAGSAFGITFTPTPPERRIVIAADVRRLVVPADTRRTEARR